MKVKINLGMNFTGQLVKILFVVFIMVFSIFVLATKVPETKFVKSTIEHLDESKDTVMKFSGATLATSVAITALPDDIATPLADTLADMNIYLVFVSIVLLVEKLIVVEGIKISFLFIIPAACALYLLGNFFKREIFRSFFMKLMIFGVALLVVIPFSTHFTNWVCADYMAYVEETIEEADLGAAKVNEIIAENEEESTFFEKVSAAFDKVIAGATDLLNYFSTVIKKCVNSIAIMIVTSFVLPMLIFMLFRWLLKELFAIKLPAMYTDVRLRQMPVRKESKSTELIQEDKIEENTESVQEEEL